MPDMLHINNQADEPSGTTNADSNEERQFYGKNICKRIIDSTIAGQTMQIDSNGKCRNWGFRLAKDGIKQAGSYRKIYLRT